MPDKLLSPSLHSMSGTLPASTTSINEDSPPSTSAKVLKLPTIMLTTEFEVR